MHNHLKFSLLLSALVASTAPQAATWVLADDFGLTNPSGAWSYGYTAASTPGGAVTVSTQMQPNGQFTNRGVPTTTGNLLTWTGPEWAWSMVDGAAPMIGKFYGNKSGDSRLDSYYGNWSDASVKQRTGGVVLAPSSNYCAAVKWTAPTAGKYFIKADFYNAGYDSTQTRGATTDVYVFVNGIQKRKGAVSGINGQDYWSTGSAGLTLAKSQVVQFAVCSTATVVIGGNGNGDSSTYDSVGLDAMILNMDSKQGRLDNVSTTVSSSF